MIWPMSTFMPLKFRLSVASVVPGNKKASGQNSLPVESMGQISLTLNGKTDFIVCISLKYW